MCLAQRCPSHGLAVLEPPLAISTSPRFTGPARTDDLQLGLILRILRLGGWLMLVHMRSIGTDLCDVLDNLSRLFGYLPSTAAGPCWTFRTWLTAKDTRPLPRARTVDPARRTGTVRNYHIAGSLHVDLITSLGIRQRPKSFY